MTYLVVVESNKILISWFVIECPSYKTEIRSTFKFVLYHNPKF